MFDPTLLRAPRDHGAPLRDRIERLVQEVASGRRDDAGRAVQHDFSDAARDAALLASHATRSAALSASQRWTDRLQSALAGMETSVASLAETASTALSGPDAAGRARLAGQAGDVLADLIGALGTRQDGRQVFGNGAAGAGPVGSVAAIRADLRTAVAGAADLADLTARVDAFFGDGGPFATNHLTVSRAAPVRLPDGTGGQVDLDVDATSGGVRAALRAVALLSVLPEAGSSSDPSASDLAAQAQARLQGALTGIVDLRADIGAVEARLSVQAADLAAERVAAEQRQSDRLGVDPAEAATRLRQEMDRLDATYAITARRAQLRLTGYLR